MQLHGKFDIYSTKNGLSQNDVRCLFQDSYGFIWIGTHGGLNRFDGYSFKTYQKNIDDPTSLPSNLISSLAEDQHGNLWIATDDQGIVIMDRQTESFQQLRHEPADPNTITNNHVITLFIDSKGIVWAGTSTGLNRIEYDHHSKSAKVQRLTADKNNPNSISHNHIYHLFEDKFGNVWVGTINGLNRYISTDDTNHQFLSYRVGTSNNIRHITSNDTSLLIATTLNVLALPFSQINTNTPDLKVIVSQPFLEIISDQHQNLWGINNTGVSLHYVQNGQMKDHQFVNSWADPKSLSKNIATAIIEDRSGLIWIGTNGGGLNLYNPDRKNFKHYHKNVSPGSLSYNKIRGIEEDPQGNLWIGTEGGGLNFLPAARKNEFESGFKQIDINRGTGNFVFSLESTKQGYLLAGAGYPASLYVLDANHTNTPKIVETFNAKGNVFSILQDSDDNIWLGTYSNGLYRMTQDNNGHITVSAHFTHEPEDYSSLSSNVVRSIGEDRDGNLWIGTDEGLNKITRQERTKDTPNIIRYKQGDHEKSISYDYILPIFISSTGDIWIGTLGGGLNKLIPGTTPNNDRFEHITTSDGLPNNVVKSIQEDDQGNLWLGTNKGLSKYNPKTQQITNYGISDGLQDMEFSEIASHRLSSGELIFGGVDGFNVFDPQDIIPDTSEVNVVFTELQILNRTINTGEEINGRIILSSDLNRTQTLELFHNENSFSVKFAALHYAAPEKNKYAYKLEGFDKEWIYTSAQNRIAKYTNLAPGTYTLLVKASNSDDYWTEDPIRLQVQIAPPFWRTHLAMISYIILIVTALWFFRKYTLITNSRKNQLVIEHLEREKIEELSQLKLRFFTNVSHEFRTPLTLILGLIERLKNTASKLDETERQKYYDKIHRNSQVLLNLINQLLDFRKVEQGKMKVKVQHGDIGTYIHGLCENFNELARKKNIDFQFICEEPISGYHDKDIIERITFNLLSNAFKFTNEEGEITVSLEAVGDALKMQVVDTGIGMSKEVQDHLFDRFSHTFVKREHGSGIGLSYTKGLVELYHGEIQCESAPDRGTTFSITFPFKKEAFSQDIILDDQDQDANTTRDVDWLIENTSTQVRESQVDPSGQKATVLLVEDNEDILFYLEEHFKDRYIIHKANEGQGALNICLDKHVDLVVSDVMMPGMDGLEFCEKLKEDDRINHIPVILLTAKRSPDNKVKGYEKGADAYIPKPFDMNELETRMEALISGRQKILSKLRKNIELKPSEVKVTSLDEKFLKRVLSYIEENIGMTEFTVEMLAHECGMSQLHLNKKLKVLVGQTANAFIRSIRLKRAAQLLSKNRYSVNEVMYEVGFIDAKYFRTCFKKEFGTTPSDYQKTHAEEES
ncbi:hybrid sensor histidine kinase/response regulator transcription factor [Marinoscillum furvescens]|uniref:histidine kinase n=1 Tax=Marinoscillum furvescens DSM 4134 TaxID=1122208 RepID=A0A3D9KZN2_MARFU|nr:hybrid sensor histidine kinase/response regulator transcription factor [Marinoscillum furvescens]RED96020.1 two component regulator with propeller domain [Marinoscillum furvescens DSM 4134]